MSRFYHIPLTRPQILALLDASRGYFSVKKGPPDPYSLDRAISRLETSLKKAPLGSKGLPIIERGVERVLDCSTGHITAEEMDVLSDPPPCPEDFPVRAAPHDYGAVLFLYPGQDMLSHPAWERWPNILATVKLALSRTCQLLNFDRDGCEHKELSKFDW